jgi:hypothetical protein
MRQRTYAKPAARYQQPKPLQPGRDRTMAIHQRPYCTLLRVPRHSPSNDFPSPYFRHMQNYLTNDSRGRCYSRKLTSVNSVLTGYGRWWPFPLTSGY